MTAELDFIHQFVPGTSDRTLLLLHGTGCDQHDLIPLGRELDPTALHQEFDFRPEHSLPILLLAPSLTKNAVRH